MKQNKKKKSKVVDEEIVDKEVSESEDNEELEEIDESRVNVLPKEKEQWRVKLIRYSVIVVISLSLFFIVLALRNFFSDTITLNDRFRFLADGISIPGVALLGVGLLILIGSKGAFTGLGYAGKRVLRFFLPFLFRKQETYAEYLEKIEHKKRTKTVLTFIIAGGAEILLSVVFIVLFYTVK